MLKSTALEIKNNKPKIYPGLYIEGKWNNIWLCTSENFAILVYSIESKTLLGTISVNSKFITQLDLYNGSVTISNGNFLQKGD